MAGQITGAEAVLQALNDNEPITMVLVDREKDTTLIRTTVSYTHLTLPTILLV